jgi:hypothetical protein
MSEPKLESDGTGRAAADKASDKASSPSRRRALKAALASAPIIMSIKSRPAFAGPTCDQQTGSCQGSARLSARPAPG